MSFYLLLPVLLRRLTSTSSYLAFLLACLAASALASLAFAHLWSDAYPAHQQYLVSSFLYYNFFSQLPIFALGMLAYRVIENRGHLLHWVIGGTVAFLPFILLPLVQPASPLAHAVPSHIVMGALFAVLALALARFPLRLLVNPLIIQLGKISFSMYLLHFAVIELFTKLGLVDLFPSGNISSALFYMLIVAITALLSYMTYLLVERRGVRLGNRLIARLELESSQHVPHTVQSFPSRL
jgi:peptidoglycan/LPS O-acetylase OafA/YrhL